MSAYMDGYRDGFRTARLKNAEEVYEAQCDALEKELAQLAAQVQRRHPSQSRREMMQYIKRSRYFAGFCEGYVRAQRGEDVHNR